MATLSQSHRGLTSLLYVLSVIEALAGLALLFASNWVLSLLVIPGGTAAEGGLVLLLTKGIGIVALAFGYLMCVAARSPVRYIAIIDTLIFLLVAAAALNIYGIAALGLGALYPASYLIVRAIVEFVLAVVLVVLRPKGAPTP
jgi:hypothetical protein